MKYPTEYDIIKVNGAIPDWIDDNFAYFGSPDDYYVIDLKADDVTVQFFNLIEVQAE